MNKQITYDRNTGDFRVMVNDVLIGYYASRTEAQRAADAYVYESLRRAPIAMNGTDYHVYGEA